MLALFENIFRKLDNIIPISNIVNNLYLSKVNFNNKLSVTNYKRLLVSLYKGRSGFVCEIDRDNPELAKRNIYLTYGEILPEGLERLLIFLQPTESDSFVDLGSGAGKTVLQSFLCTNIKNSYGIEIDGARYNLALDAVNQLKQTKPEVFNNDAKTIDFLNINISDFDFNKATLVFANSTCFGDNLMTSIIKEINRSPNIRAVMSTKKIDNLEYLPNFETILIETSWHVPPNKSHCYVYYR